MGNKNVLYYFAFVARFCFAIFALSSQLTFASVWDGDKYIKRDSFSSGKDVWVKNPNFGQPLKNGQAISKTASLQPSYKNKPLPSFPVTLSAEPSAVKAGVKNLLRGGLAGIAITEGIGALFDAVDWVLDPENHTVKKNTDFDNGVPSKTGFLAAADAAGCVLSFRNNTGLRRYHCSTSYGLYSGSVGAEFASSTQHAGVCPAICPVGTSGSSVSGTIQTPVSSSEIDTAVDNNYNLHPNDISQLVAERSAGAFVKPNLVYIGDSPDGSVSLSQFPVSDVTNTETITIPHPNDSTTESKTINYLYDGKNLSITVPPNINNSAAFEMYISKSIETSLDFMGTNQPAKSVTYNSSTQKYELSEPLGESDSPSLDYTVVTNETYIVNGDIVYDSSTTTNYQNDNEVIVKDSIFPPFCEWASVVCDFISWFTDPPEPPDDGDFESLRPKNLPIPSLETDILTANKNCPAPKEIPIGSLNTTLTFKYDQICSAVSAINPFFLIICYISAARIVLRA